MTSIFLQLRKSQNVLNFCSHLFENQLRSELIFKKVATEIEHILRLSKLKEYASH